MKLAILVFTNFERQTAEVRRVRMLGRGLKALGHEVHIVVPFRFSDGGLSETIEDLQVHWGLNLADGNWASLSNRIKGRMAAFRLIRSLVREDLDWLLLYNCGFEAVPITLYARRKGVKVAAEYCDVRVLPSTPSLGDRVRVFWQESADKIVPKNSNLNIAISQYLRDWLQKLSPRTPNLILPPLVDSDQFQHSAVKAAEFREKWKIDGRTALISYLGSFWNIDGVGGLLNAVARLRDEGVDFRLSISGMPLEGRDNDDVDGLVKEFKLEDRVILTGWLQTEQVLAALSAADILVVPKVDHVINRAGMPTKMTEYLSMGKPVVTTRVGDIPLYLEHRKNGWLCRPGDDSDLSAALKELIQDSGLRERLGVAARKIAMDKFDYRAAGRIMEGALLAA